MNIYLLICILLWLGETVWFVLALLISLNLTLGDLIPVRHPFN